MVGRSGVRLRLYRVLRCAVFCGGVASGPAVMQGRLARLVGNKLGSGRKYPHENSRHVHEHEATPGVVGHKYDRDRARAL